MRAIYLKDKIGNKVVTVPYYRIGDLFLTTIATNPSSYLGGKWELFGPGRCLVCVDTSQAEFNSVKKTGGEKRHTLTRQEMPRISGQINFHGNGSGGTVVNNTNGDFISSSILNGYFGGSPISGAVSVGLITMDVGGNQAHNNLQPFITCYVWIRIA